MCIAFTSRDYDTVLALLMTALNISNALRPPSVASIYFELYLDQAKANASNPGYFVNFLPQRDW